jgi:tRNA (guanosine-2'-O-)-methyltransferase
LTEKRFHKIQQVVSRRQKYLTIILENIHDPHNVSAILRSADAVGIDKVYLIYNTCKFPKVGRVSSASASKWIELVKFKNVKDCFDELKEMKFKIYSTYISETERNYSLFELNLTGKIALVFGNEHEGVSDDVKRLADRNFLVPMYGMVQSLNVSVTVAVCLYETLRQREIKGKYDKSEYGKKELKEKLNYYLKK